MINKSKKILDCYVQLRKKHQYVGFPQLISHCGFTYACIRHYWHNLISLEDEFQKKFPKLKYKSANQEARDKKELEILTKYCLVKNKNGIVSIPDLVKLGLPATTIHAYYKTLHDIDSAARQAFPDKFKDVRVDIESLSYKGSDLSQDLLKYKRFVITTAVLGCKTDINFLNSIRNYCDKNNAKLLVILSADPSSVLKWTLDKNLADEKVIYGDLRLNSNIFISTIKLSAKHIDPITSLGRIGQRHGSFIYASPKQRLKMVPVSNNKLPHALMTTGAITLPNYNTKKYMSERTAYIAENDHVIGGIILELVDNKSYHFRQIQADRDGSFIDLGKKYTADSITMETPEAFVLGDWHSGETDRDANKCWKEISKELKPKCIVFHDIFDGASINHHEQHKNILRAIRADTGKNSLKEELIKLADDIDTWVKFCPNLVIVKSNHDEFLERYLQEGKYVEDHINYRLSLDLASAMYDGFDPLKFGVERFLKNKNNVKWLKTDEDYYVKKIQLGAHGHRGANGAKGSIASIEAAYSNSVTGHSHTPQILRGAWVVGTSSNLKLSYNSGPSSWLHSSCLVYANGSRQLINVIDGKWRL